MPVPRSKQNDAFSAEDAARIREMIRTPGAKVTCPRCGEEITTAVPFAGGGTAPSVFELRCESCDKKVFVSDLRLGQRDP